MVKKNVDFFFTFFCFLGKSTLGEIDSDKCTVRSCTVNSFVNILHFVFASIRIFDWSNSFEARVYNNVIFSPVVNICYFHSGVLSIIITLDRMTYFSARLKNMFKISPYKVCLIAFVLCFLIDLPFFFVFAPATVDVKINRTYTFTIWYSYPSYFARTLLGQVITFMIYALRDCGVTLVQIGLNAASVYMLKKYLSQKIQNFSKKEGSASSSKLKVNSKARVRVQAT